MNKVLSVFLCIALAVSSTGIYAFAQCDEQYIPVSAKAADANGDGKVTAADVLLLRKYLAGWSVTPCYERSDANGDGKITAADVLLIRKKLAGWSVTLYGSFAVQRGDVTSELRDLGISYISDYPNSGGKEDIIARNPYDMASYDGKVFVSAGNYSSNKGPVNIVYYTRTSEKSKRTSALQTEQVNNFYIFNNTLYTVAVDPLQWGTGEYYEYKPKTGKWTTRSVLTDNIHCYDMAYYNGMYFFGGANVEYVYNEMYQESNKEIAPACVFRSLGGELANTDSSYYKDVPFCDQGGDELDIYFTGRIYKFAEFKGELYAFHAYYWESRTKQGYLTFKYNVEKDRFELCEDESSLSIPYRSGEADIQDRENNLKTFEWGDMLVAVNNCLLTSADLKSWDMRKIPGYEKYTVRDCEVIGDKVYIIANIQTSDGRYNNILAQTDDFENYRIIMNFDTLGWIKSFAYCDGAFFFGTGVDANEDFTSESAQQCGRVYLYIYYK